MDAFFSPCRPGRPVTHGETTFDLPILYFRDDAFAAFFAADYRRVEELMPTDRLHPVRLPDGRAAVAIAAFNYIDTSIGPYGEVAVAVPAVHGRRPPRLLPALLEARWPGFGSLVLHLPVTAMAAREAGRGEWGYTKFVTEMDFVNTPEFQEVRMSEDDRHILTLRVARQGIPLSDRKPLVTYSVRDRNLIRTTIPQRGTCRNALFPKDSRLELGGHPVARELQALGLSSRPFLCRYYVERAGILPSGVVVEERVRPLDGYAGKDREGRHTVRYLEGSV